MRLALVILFTFIVVFAFSNCKKDKYSEPNGVGNYIMNGDYYNVNAITNYENKHKNSLHSGIFFQGGLDKMILEIGNLPLRAGENLINTSDLICNFSFLDVDVFTKEWELVKNDSNSIIVKSYNKHKCEIEFNLYFKEFQNDTANNSGPENIRIKSGYIKSGIRKYRND